jgi:hypothetical protein
MRVKRLIGSFPFAIRSFDHFGEKYIFQNFVEKKNHYQ